MKEEDDDTSGCVAYIAVLLVAMFLATLFAYSVFASGVCKQLGWDGGGTHGAYDGYCFERNEDGSEYRECDLSYVLAGECDPTWPEAE